MQRALLFGVTLSLVACGGENGRDFGRDDPLARTPSVTWDPAAYPAPPYGARELSVIPNLEFAGWLDPVAAGYDPASFERVGLSEFYDPGATDIRYIYMTVVEVWCPWCQAIYKHIRDNHVYPGYRAKGVEFFGVLTEDADRNPARPEDLVSWARDRYLVEFPMVIDPAFKTAPYHDSSGTPLNVLIDARDMRILYKLNGVPGGGGVPELFATLDAIMGL
jgi:hypothetical protein